MSMFYKLIKIAAVLIVLLWIGAIGVRIMNPPLYASWKGKLQEKWNSWFGTYHMQVDDNIL